MESYTTLKLSDDDKRILKIIYKYLETIVIPTSYRSGTTGLPHHASKTGTTSQKDARQTCFGMVRYKGVLQKSISTIKYPSLMPLLKKFMKSHCPKFKFNSVYVNKNAVCKRHFDSKNVGVSLLVGLGDYTGGQTILYVKNKERKFHIKSTSLLFNGSTVEHRSEEFKGTRYSLVFFTTY